MVWVRSQETQRWILQALIALVAPLRSTCRPTVSAIRLIADQDEITVGDDIPLISVKVAMQAKF